MNVLEEITSGELENIYQVMIKRIAKGYTAEQLSFLIGKEAGYISAIELLDAPFYTISELKKIALVLEENDLNSFFLKESDETSLLVVMERDDEGNTRKHTCSIIDEDQEKQPPLFLIKEDISEDLAENMTSKEDWEIANKAVKLLIRSGYFYEAKMPFEVCQSVNRFLTIPVSPFYIQQALNSLITDGAEEALLNKIQQEDEGYLYIEA